MPNIIINHNRVGPIGQDNGDRLYQVALEPPTQYIERGRSGSGNQIRFDRKNPEQHHGFEVKLFDESGNLIAERETRNASPVVIDVPTVTVTSVYSYKIYYPWDAPNQKVLPLDPVIIIEPKNSQNLASQLISVGTGAAITLITAWMVKTFNLFG